MVAITVILAAVIAAFVFGMSPPPKAPTVQLRIQAVNSATVLDSVVKLTHNGGDSLILKDEKITITDAISGAYVDDVNALTLVEFQNPQLNLTSLGAGASLTHQWTNVSTTPAKGAILKVMIQDIPSGQVITQMQVTVT